VDWSSEPDDKGSYPKAEDAIPRTTEKDRIRCSRNVVVDRGGDAGVTFQPSRDIPISLVARKM
jgi:hypothetical protein